MNYQINNCRWAFKCPQTWEKLEATASQKVKFCRECEKHVFLCQDEEEVQYHAQRLNCIYLEPTAEDETQWAVMGRYLPPEYQGPTMKIILEPVSFLDPDQIKFLVRSFDLGRSDLNWPEILGDGRQHILKTKIPPAIAESLVKRLEDRNIAHRLEVEPD